jgi:hypothetical protein
LASLYGVTTKALNQALKRNINRFPSDFAFQLVLDEFERVMWSQIVTTSLGDEDETRRSQNAIPSEKAEKSPKFPNRSRFVTGSGTEDATRRSQFVTASEKFRNPRFLP